MLLLGAVTGLVVGGALGTAWGLAAAAGYFNHWQRLSTPEQPATGLVADSYDQRILVRLADGTTVDCYRRCEPVTPARSGYLPPDTTPDVVSAPCDPLGPVFALLSRAPRGRRDCLAMAIPMPEGSYSDMVLLDGDGSPWSWRVDNSGMFGSLPTVIIDAISAATLGTIIGLVTSPLLADALAAAAGRARRRRPQGGP